MPANNWEPRQAKYGEEPMTQYEVDKIVVDILRERDVVGTKKFVPDYGPSILVRRRKT